MNFQRGVGGGEEIKFLGKFYIPLQNCLSYLESQNEGDADHRLLAARQGTQGLHLPLVTREGNVYPQA